MKLHVIIKRGMPLLPTINHLLAESGAEVRIRGMG